MELQELKVKAFDLIAQKEKYLVEIEKIQKELNPIIEKIASLENGIK
jgi:hypothetical protein